MLRKFFCTTIFTSNLVTKKKKKKTNYKLHYCIIIKKYIHLNSFKHVYKVLHKFYMRKVQLAILVIMFCNYHGELDQFYYKLQLIVPSLFAY